MCVRRGILLENIFFIFGLLVEAFEMVDGKYEDLTCLISISFN